MTEERRDCTKCINNDGCHIHCICHNQDKWQPIAQEKPMEKIQMTEEQAYEICRIISGSNNWDEDLKKLKQKGYIRKTALEEAEEEYIAYKEGKNCFVAEIVMDKMYLAIQELKSEIARLKGREEIKTK